MRRWGRRQRRGPVVGVVVPAYGVEEWIGAALDSLTAQTWTAWRAVVVDDGSPDRSGEIAGEHAARDERITVVRTGNAGLGAARNHGARLLETDYLGFLDADDVLPPDALATLVGSLERSGSDFAVGTLLRCEPEPPAGRGPLVPPWMRRLHAEPRQGIGVGEHPEILGDVFAPNKLFRRTFWDDRGLAWPERVRYEDQPTTTRAYLAGRFDVLPEVVYHWQIRSDGTSITQQRASVEDLVDRWATKRMALDAVLGHGDPEVTEVFLDRVLPGDMWRYFELLPDSPADSEWARLLVRGVQELWGDRSLTGSVLPPVHRLCGWLLEQDRYADAAALMSWMRSRTGRAPRTPDGTALDLPGDVLDPGTVAPEALAVRPGE